jgi:sulfite exporter TauE/SafE
MSAYLFEAFMLGLSTGPVCLAYCAPILVPLVVADDEDDNEDKEKEKDKPRKYGFSRTLRLLGLFLLGRLGGYLAVGVVTGFMGSRVFNFEEGASQAVITLLIGVLLLVFGLMKNFPRLKLCKIWPGGRSTAGWGVVLGFLTGLSLCPPFIAAITASAALGSLQGSVFYFLAFFIGTAVYIPPMILLGPLSRVEAVNHVARICLVLTGSWFTFKGLMLL